MLTASEIAVQIRLGEIAWPGELRGDGLLLRLGSPLQSLTNPGHVIDLTDQDSINDLYASPLHDWDHFELPPGHMVLCPASQPMRLGARLAAGIAGLSHLARMGLATHVTSPWVMPGWDGHLAFELLNTGPATLRLLQDMPIARAVIWLMDGATQKPVTHAHYGYPDQLSSQYAAEFGVALPLDHIDAAADAAPGELANVATAAEQMRELIGGVFGPVIIAEHGPRGCKLGASCCSHAHLHMIPVPDVDAVTTAYQATGGPGRRLNSLADLTGKLDEPYLYLSPRPGEHLLWPSAGFARQYVRRVCAGLHGVADRFDWRDYPFDANQACTIAMLRAAMQARAA